MRGYTYYVHAWLYSTREYIPRVAISQAWLYSTRGYIPRVTIPRVAMRTPRVELHETCMFHDIRKRGPRKHVTGYIGFHA